MISWILVIRSVEFFLEVRRCFLIPYFMNEEGGFIFIWNILSFFRSA